MKERFKNWEKPIFDVDDYAMSTSGRRYGWRCHHPEKLKLGEKVDIGCFSYLNAGFVIEIGDNVQIGSHCSIYSISTEDNKQGKVIIGENTVVGAHCIIMPGVTIGKNSVVGANSFVNHAIPDGVLAYGTPCKVVKKL